VGKDAWEEEVVQTLGSLTDVVVVAVAAYYVHHRVDHEDHEEEVEDGRMDEEEVPSYHEASVVVQHKFLVVVVVGHKFLMVLRDEDELKVEVPLTL
jgi:hypothetical protein